MKSLLIAAVLSSTIMASESSAQVKPDTAAILHAAGAGGAPVEAFRIVGDTAWVGFKTSRTTKADTIKSAPDLTAIYENKTWDHWEARVERGLGKWVRVSTTKKQ